MIELERSRNILLTIMYSSAADSGTLVVAAQARMDRILLKNRGDGKIRGICFRKRAQSGILIDQMLLIFSIAFHT